MLGLGTKLTSSSGLGDVKRNYNFLQDSLPRGVTHTRLSNATMRGSDGYLKFAPNNLLTQSSNFALWSSLDGSNIISSNNADPFGGTSAFKLDAHDGLENLVPKSEAFDQWTDINCTTTSSSDPFGGNAAFTLSGSGSGDYPNADRREIAGISVTANVVYYASVYVKLPSSNPSSLFRIQLNDNAITTGSSPYPVRGRLEVSVNVANGAFETASSDSINTIKYDSVGGGWYRISFQFTPPATSTNLSFRLIPDSTTPASSNTGKDVTFFGAQLNTYAVKPYLKTEGTATDAHKNNARFEKSISLVNGQCYVASIYAKRVDSELFQISLTGDGGYSPAYSHVSAIDVKVHSDGTMGLNTASGNYTPTNITFTDVGNGWVRCSFKFVSNVTTSSFTFRVRPDRSTGYLSTLFYGPQLEATFGTQPTDYNATTSLNYYGPRLDYTKDGAFRGILTEKEMTNLDTEAFSLSTQTGNSNVAITSGPSSVLDPTGNTRAYSINADSTDSYHYHRRAYTVTNDTTYVYSVFAKANGYNVLGINASSGTDANTGPQFDLTTGAKIYDNGSHLTNVEEYSNGWYRISIKYVTHDIELVTNGGFDTNSGWTEGTGWTTTGGVATRTAQSGSTACDQNLTLVAGRKYTITYDLTRTAGTFRVRFAGTTNVDGADRTASGSYSDTLTAVTGNNQLRLVGVDAAFAGTVDNVSVKEVSLYIDHNIKEQASPAGGTFSGNGGGILLFGSQLEQYANNSTSFIPTWGTNAEATRKVDQFKVDDVDDFFKTTEGTFVAEGEVQNNYNTSYFERVYVFDDSVGNFVRSMQGMVASDETIRTQVVDSGSDELTLNDNVNISNGEVFKIAHAFKHDDRHKASFDGGDIKQSFGQDLLLNQAPTAANGFFKTNDTSEIDITGSGAVFDTGSNSQDVHKDINLVTGRTYKVVFDITSYTKGGVKVRAPFSDSNVRSSTGTFTAIGVASTTSVSDELVMIQSQGETQLTVGSVRVTEVGTSTNSTFDIPAGINRIRMGYRGGNNENYNGWIRRMRYYNKFLSDSRLKNLSNSNFLGTKYKGIKGAHSLRNIFEGNSTQKVVKIRRTYDEREQSFSASDIDGGIIENFHKAEEQKVLPLNISADASELVTNGTFADTSAWTTGTGWSINTTNDYIERTAQSSASASYQSVPLIAGKKYQISYDLIRTAGTLTFKLTSGTNVNGAARTASGSYSEVLTAVTGNASIQLSADAAFAGIVDNVSVKEVSPEPTGVSTRLINSNHSGKSLMRCRHASTNQEVEVFADSNDEISLLSPIVNCTNNLLAYSECFTEWTLNSSGSVSEAPSITDPFGGNNAYLLQASGSNAWSGIYYTISSNPDLELSSSKQYTFSVYLKANTSSKTRISFYDSNTSPQTQRATVDWSGESSGVATINVGETVEANTTAYGQLESVGNGWYRLSLSVSPVNHDGTQSVTIEPDRNAASKSVYVYGAMLNESTHTPTNITVTGYDSTFSGTGPKQWGSSNSSLASVSGGKGVFNTSNTQNLRIFNLLTKGKKYRVQFDVEDYQSGAVKPHGPFSTAISDAFTPASANGTYTFEGLANDHALYISSVGATELKVDNVIVTELSDVVTPTYASTPVYTASPDNDTSDTIATTLGEFASSSDCHVVTWHDQGGGRQKDFIQENAAYQPRIVIAGSLVTDSGGKASVSFDGGDILLNNKLKGHKTFESYYVTDSNDDTYAMPSGTGGNDGGALFDDGSSSNVPYHNTYYGTTDTNFFINGAELTAYNRDQLYEQSKGHSVVTHQNVTTAAWTSFQVGKWASFSEWDFAGKISEMVFFPNQDSSQKRFEIEQNIIRHYDLNLVKNGGFDTNTDWFTGTGWSIDNGIASIDGSQSTWSMLRQENILPPAGVKVEVTITVSNYSAGALYIKAGADDAGFQITANGTYTTIRTIVGANQFRIQADPNFVGSVDNVKVQWYGTDGHVVELFDQSGNNNPATQTTAAHQPQIIKGGSLIKSGGYPAWDFITGNPQRSLTIHGLTGITDLDAFFVHDANDTKFIYPSSGAGSYFGFPALDVAEGETSATNLSSAYGGPVLEVNGSEPTQNNQDAVYEAIKGRKLVYHRSASTTGWPEVNIGNTFGTNDLWNLEDVKFSEMIWYDSDQHGNQSGIESNINSHYNIY